MALTRFNVQNGLSVGTGSIGVIDSEGAGTFTNLTSTGNLTVLGDKTFISSSTVEFASNFINLNISSTPSIFGGIYFNDVNSGQTGSLIWDSYTNQWLQGLKGTEQAFPMGVGTINALVKWDGFTSLSSSIIFDNGTNVGIGRLNPGSKLDVDGAALISGSLTFGSDSLYDIGSVEKKVRSVFANYLTGSLTTLANGSPYLLAGPNMIITTGSGGQITLEATLSAGTISGLGTLNYLPKYASAGTVINSNVYDDGSGVSVFAPLTASIIKSDSIETISLISSHISGVLTASNISVGSIVFAGDGGLLTGSQGRLFWDSGSLGIGIGTSVLSPTATFTVSGSSELIGDVYVSGSILPTADSIYTLGDSTNRWDRVHARALSGSLTTLGNGDPYLLGGPGISISTGSTGAITLSYSGINSITAGNGLTGGGSSGNVTLAIDEGVVARVNGTTFTGDVKFNAGLSGSLTRLANGSPYIVASTGIRVVTGSTGELTFSIKDSEVATISGSTFSGAVKFSGGLSGSLTTLTNGNPYLVAGDNVTITTGSAGEITISSTAGGTINGDGDPNYITKWKAGNELTGSKIYDDGSNVRILLPMSVTGSLLPGENSQFNLGSVSKRWNTVFSDALTGSLTRLSNGDAYLTAGSGISIATGSNGQVTITGNIGTITNVSPGVGLLGGGSTGNATLRIDDSVVATLTGSNFSGDVKFLAGVSGSLQRLVTGEAYIVGGSNVTVTTGSSGQIIIDAAGGGGAGGLVDGSGVQNYSARWEDTNTLSYGVVYDDGFSVGIGTVSGGDKLTISGSTSLTGSFLPGSDAIYDIGSDTKRWNVFAANVSGSLTGSGLIEGSVVFSGPGGLLTGSNAKFFWDNSNGRLGLGTTFPTSILTVSGTSHFSGTLEPGASSAHDIGTTSKIWRNVYAANISGSLTGSGLQSGSVLFAGPGGLVSGSNSKLFWDNSNSRLGVGTDSPNYSLEVYGVSGSLFSVEDRMSGSLLSVSGISGIPIMEVFSDFRTVFAGGFNSTTMVVSASSVGIGTSSTTNSRLYVGGTSTASSPVLVVQAGTASPTAKVLDIRNSSGTSVASIDHLGNISGSTLTVNAGAGSFSNDVTIAGNLTVNGTSTVLNTNSLTVRDNIVVLNASSTPSATGGLYVNDTVANVTGSLIWDSTTDRWRAGLLGSEINLVTTSSVDSLFNKTLTISGSSRNYITGGISNSVVFFDVTGSLSSSGAFTYSSSPGIFSFSGSLMAFTSSVEPGTDLSYNLGSATKRWSTVYSDRLTGSLTTLSDGTSYLVAGNNIIIQTGSNGAILITAQSSGGSGGGSAVGGFGTAGRVTRWAGTIDLGDSVIYDNGTNIGVGGSATSDKMSVYGTTAVTGSLLPGDDASYPLGSTSKRWLSLNAVNISGSLTGSGFLSGTVVFAGPGGVLTGSNSQLF